MSITGQSVSLEWTAPESDAYIFRYVVICGSPVTPRALYSREIVYRTTHCTLTNMLSSGKTYQFAVAAINDAGRGEFSDFSSSFTFPGKSGKGIEMC